jgi:hypothetical protein
VSFLTPRWSPGILLQTAAGNANDPNPASSHLVGWQLPVGSFSLPDPFPDGATPIYAAAVAPSIPAVLATWGP